MEPYPSLADCYLHRWQVHVHCGKCRVVRTFHDDLSDLILSPFWSIPLDEVMVRFKCRRIRNGAPCGEPADSITVSRVVPLAGGQRYETVLKLERQ